MVDAQLRLEYAVAATRFGRGQVTVARQIRRRGLDAFDAIHRALTSEQLTEVLATVDELRADGIGALLLSEPDYPRTLVDAGVTAPALFVKGPLRLLDRHGLGICGSRAATAEGLRAARACSELIASHGFNVVSGYARGVDMTSHIGALSAGGSTIVVLPEGIQNFQIRRGELEALWDPTRIVVISQFSPRQPWRAAGAMARNAVICGLSKALVVVEAGETGGTLAAGLHALERDQPVLTLELFGAPPGNQVLVSRGATAVRDREQLEGALFNLPSNGSPQLTLL